MAISSGHVNHSMHSQPSINEAGVRPNEELP